MRLFAQAAEEAATGGRLGLLEVYALHGAMGPAERQTEFALFNGQNEHLSSSGETIRVLVSTDVGSRGLDLKNAPAPCNMCV
eukprot:COSAG03_NODE_321_length_9007_cov_6.783341_6_plen_82_part_00